MALTDDCCDVTPFNVVKIYQCSRGVCYHLQSEIVFIVSIVANKLCS